MTELEWTDADQLKADKAELMKSLDSTDLQLEWTDADQLKADYHLS